MTAEQVASVRGRWPRPARRRQTRAATKPIVNQTVDCHTSAQAKPPLRLCDQKPGSIRRSINQANHGTSDSPSNHTIALNTTSSTVADRSSQQKFSRNVVVRRRIAIGFRKPSASRQDMSLGSTSTGRRSGPGAIDPRILIWRAGCGTLVKQHPGVKRSALCSLLPANWNLPRFERRSACFTCASLLILASTLEKARR